MSSKGMRSGKRIGDNGRKHKATQKAIRRPIENKITKDQRRYINHLAAEKDRCDLLVDLTNETKDGAEALIMTLLNLPDRPVHTSSRAAPGSDPHTREAFTPQHLRGAGVDEEGRYVVRHPGWERDGMASLPRKNGKYRDQTYGARVVPPPPPAPPEDEDQESANRLFYRDREDAERDRKHT